MSSVERLSSPLVSAPMSGADRAGEMGEDACNAIGGKIDVHQTTLSHHYRVLREAGVTWTTVQGRSRLVRLRRDDLDTLFPGLLDSVLIAERRTRATASDNVETS
ncbi:ArsR/SmtB family transcription factor [Nonomuraea sp. GTA35]|uniref:ArsR/SmtB family transcription factor n=1 Tax=Nonomuraea sp. GTA35 TaxID=1676746 RepID=UPI0035C0CC10